MLMPFLQVLSIGIVLLLAGGCGPNGELVIEDATLQVTSEPAGAEILLDDVQAGVTPMTVAIPPNRPHMVELRLPGYESHWVSLGPASPGATVEPVSVKLIAVTAPVYLLTTPSGAFVRVNGVDRGETPLALPAVPLGEHDVELSFTGYATKKIRINVKDARPLRVHEDMESVIGTLRIFSVPGSAEISLNGKAQGTTPNDPEQPLVISDLPAGSYEISATRPGYQSVSRSVLLPRNETRSVHMPSMAPLPGAVRITSTPAGAKVHATQGGQLLGETPLTVQDLPDGEHSFTISKSGYDTVERKILVSQGLVKQLDVALVTNHGSVAFITQPPGVTVYIDGRALGETQPADTPLVSRVFTENNLRPGPHQLLLVHPEYDNFSRSFFVERGKTENLGTILLKKQWIPTHTLKIKSGPTYRGILLTRFPDGSIEFERARNIRVNYQAAEIESLREIRDQQDLKN